MKQLLLGLVEAIFSFIAIYFVTLLAFAIRFQLDLLVQFSAPITVGRFVYYLIILGGVVGLGFLNRQLFKSLPQFLSWLFPALVVVWGLI